MNKNIPKSLSYYRLSLLAFLQESHPELLGNSNFIDTRVSLAINVYCSEIQGGSSQNQAEELANEILFLGLHFSKHDMLVNILWNEFDSMIPQDDAKAFAIKILPKCQELFTQYTLTDEFADSFEFDNLYTELTGFIDIYLEEHGL